MSQIAVLTNLPGAAAEAVENGTLASGSLSRAIEALSGGNLNASRASLADVRQNLGAFTFAVHLQEAVIAIAAREFGAVIEATLGARNALNAMSSEQRALYASALSEIEARISFAFSSGI